MKRPTQEQKIISYLETGKVLTVAIGAHQLNIYSSFHNCMGRLKRDYVIHQQLITKKHCTYMEYWGELEDD